MASRLAEVTVINVATWAAQPEQLAQLLGRAPTGQVIADSRGQRPDPDRMATIGDSGYWANDARGLAEALAEVAASPVARPGRPNVSAGRSASPRSGSP